MEILASVPAVVRLLLVFAFVAFLIRKKVSLGNTFLAAAIVLGALFGVTPARMVTSMAASVVYPQTLALAVIVSLIMVLSNAMEENGQLHRLLTSFKGLIRNPKLNIIMFPALIGLLPMPGGAVFSAPMVKELGTDSQYSPARLSFANYWFRHIWEYFWPMYPGVLLTAVLADINLGTLMLCTSPVTLGAFVIGYFSLAGGEPSSKDTAETPRPAVRPFIRELLPILIVIVLGLGMGFMFSRIFPAFNIAKEAGLVLSLVLAVAWVWRTNKMSVQVMGKIVVNPQMLKMVYMIFAILIFKSMLEDSQAVEAITQELTLLKVPLVLIVTLLPFLVGAITGIAMAFVGSAFPVLIPLIGSLDPAGNLLFYMMLAIVCGFAGVLLSPVHLCLILSNEYFGTTLGPVYRHLSPACLYLIITGFAYFYVLVMVSGLIS